MPLLSTQIEATAAFSQGCHKLAESLISQSKSSVYSNIVSIVASCSSHGTPNAGTASTTAPQSFTQHVELCNICCFNCKLHSPKANWPEGHLVHLLEQCVQVSIIGTLKSTNGINWGICRPPQLILPANMRICVFGSSKVTGLMTRAILCIAHPRLHY